MGVAENYGVSYFGVLILFRVLYWGLLFSETLIYGLEKGGAVDQGACANLDV